MQKFKKIISIIIILTTIGCDSNSEKNICPECKMAISKDSKINTSHIEKVYFDDIGCMILWTKKRYINPEGAYVFTKDTKEYIRAEDAHYTINEKTPMGYGFTAYKERVKGSIDFNNMRLRILRGESMRNPKIRKQILGE